MLPHRLQMCPHGVLGQHNHVVTLRSRRSSGARTRIDGTAGQPGGVRFSRAAGGLTGLLGGVGAGEMGLLVHLTEAKRDDGIETSIRPSLNCTALGRSHACFAAGAGGAFACATGLGGATAGGAGCSTAGRTGGAGFSADGRTGVAGFSADGRTGAARVSAGGRTGAAGFSTGGRTGVAGDSAGCPGWIRSLGLGVTARLICSNDGSLIFSICGRSLSNILLRLGLGRDRLIASYSARCPLLRLPTRSS